jgi:YidC/Oxa1 family membrane protein insertase
MGFFELFATALAGFYAVVKSYGLSIILLTLLVRVILLPLSIKQTRSMREMQRIQPEVKKIQAKHKGDRQKMNEEMMALYKEHGVNPFGGCLPILMQFPILIGLFYVIRGPLKYVGDTLLRSDLMSHALQVHHFLGIRLDCSASLALNADGKGSLVLPDNACGSGVVSALPYLAMVLVMGVTTWYQQKQMQASRGASGGDKQAQQMQMFAKIMPVMLMFFAFNFPAGVVLYWLTTNMWTIGQQRVILNAYPVVTPGDPGKSTPAKGKTAPAPSVAEETKNPNGVPKTSKPSPHASKKKKK